MILPVLASQVAIVDGLPARVGPARETYAYAPDKWSVKMVVRHFTDAERIFGYRALAMARGEQQSLPGFDENDYAKNSDADRRAIRDLADEYEAVRRASVTFFRGLSPDMWERQGTANNNAISVRGLALVTLGHERHHLNVLHDRYGV